MSSHPIRDQPGKYSSTFWDHSPMVNKIQHTFTVKSNLELIKKTFWGQEHWRGHSVLPSGTYLGRDSWSTNKGSLGTPGRRSSQHLRGHSHLSLKYCEDTVLLRWQLCPLPARRSSWSRCFPGFQVHRAQVVHELMGTPDNYTKQRSQIHWKT